MIATAAQHHKQETELVRLMEQAITAPAPLFDRMDKKAKLYRAARPGIAGYPLPHHTRGALVRRKYTA